MEQLDSEIIELFSQWEELKVLPKWETIFQLKVFSLNFGLSAMADQTLKPKCEINPPSRELKKLVLILFAAETSILLFNLFDCVSKVKLGILHCMIMTFYYHVCHSLGLCYS